MLAIIEKMLKQRRDSVTQYEAGGRQDLADVEKFEIGVLAPAICRSSCRRRKSPLRWPPRSRQAAPRRSQDMGKVMALLKPKLAGRADMAKVSSLVKAKLGS